MKKGRISVLLIAAMALALCDCQSNGRTPAAPAETVSASLVYTKTAISFSEPQGEIYGVQNGWMTQWDGVDYCFAPEISGADRQTVVEKCGAYPIRDPGADRSGGRRMDGLLAFRRLRTPGPGP